MDADLGGYLDLVGRQLALRFRPEDMHVANLAGALECLDSGITTLQDFSHIQDTPEHADAAVPVLREAGIRAVFGYGYPVFSDESRRPAEIRRVRGQYFATDDQLVT